MKTLDRLLIKAKKHHGTDRLSLAFIRPDGDMWLADGRIWNGKKGSGEKSITSKHNTIDEAVQAINELAERYPNHKDIVIIVDDLQE